MQKVREWLNWTHQQFENSSLFFGHGSDNAWDEAVFLVMTAMDFPIAGEPHLLEKQVNLIQQEKIKQWVSRRISHREPLPYITGLAYFCGLPFMVDERVLIPRSPIAEMIEYGFSPWLQYEPENVLDLCTGSACIAIACGYAFPAANLVATDLSAQALQVAQLNRQKHQQQNRLQLLPGNLFEALTDNQQKFDLIITNPPYVDAQDMADLPQEFTLEPALALAAGEDGLDLVHIILQQSARWLVENGVLVVEVGNSAAALQKYYPRVPFTWVDFTHGGDGVFVFSKLELLRYFAA